MLSLKWVVSSWTSISRLLLIGLLVVAARAVADTPARTLESGVWAQLVFPVNSSTYSLARLIGDDLPVSEYDNSWVVWAFATESSRYTKLGLNDNIEVGHAYWIIQSTGQDVELDVPAADPLDITPEGCTSAGGCLSVNTPAATSGLWSLRGSPYAGTLAVGDIRVMTTVSQASCDVGYSLDRSRAREVMASKLYRYNSDLGRYVVLDSESIIGSWDGFWVRTLSDDEGPIQMVFPAPNDTAAANTRLLDEFCVDTLAITRADPDDGTAIRTIEFVDGLALTRAESPDSVKKSSRLRLTAPGDSVYAMMALQPDSVYEGSARAGASVNFEAYNTIGNGGNGDGQTGDVGFHLRIGFRGDGSPRFAYGAYHYTNQFSADDYFVLDGLQWRTFENLVPEPGVFYRLAIAIDRINRTVTFSVDDTSLTYSLPTPLYFPASSHAAMGARADRGPAVASVAIKEVGTDDAVASFSEGERYFLYDATDRGQRDVSMDVQNGELNFEVLSSSDSTAARLRVIEGQSGYGSAMLRLSADSVVADSGSVSVAIGGPLYFANDIPSVNGLLDMVFVLSELWLDNSGKPQARYCAWQSLAVDFSTSISLTNPDSDSGCASFSLGPQLDRNHSLAVWLDENNRHIVFSIDGEEHEVAITTPVSIDDSLGVWIRANAEGAGSKVVAYADNLRVASTAAIENGRIRSLEQFQATIVGKTLIQREADGSRDETTTLMANSNGTVTGTVDGSTVSIDWDWNDDLFCRSGTGGSADAPFTIEFQCQVVTIAAGVVTFANRLDETDARSYFVE